MNRILTILLISTILVICFICPINAGPIPDSGQTRDYNAAVIGEDSRYLINPPSYIKLDQNGMALPDHAKQWTMVKDQVTSLVWEVNQKGKGLHGRQTTYTWKDAQNVFITKLNESKFGGFSDWRLPTVTELARIVHMDNYNPSINTLYFPMAWHREHWTATAYAKDPAKAWQVHFSRGSVSETDNINKYRVRAVRGPKELPVVMVNNGNGTVTDPNTGLMWQKQYSDAIAWIEAVKSSESAHLAGYDDWRLPNVTELQSIVDYSLAWPAMDTVFFDLPQPESMACPVPEGEKDITKTVFIKGKKAVIPIAVDKRFSFWSASTYASNSENAWNVDFKMGRYYTSKKEKLLLSRMVRGGQHWKEDRLYVRIPEQGRQYTVGKTMTVSWDTGGIAGNVDIRLSRTGGKKESFSENIAHSIPNTGKFLWQITGPASPNCMMRIIPQHAPEKSTSQGLFSIVPPKK